jgi:DNA polymerase III, epsilon subunit and related 3''-5'' exonucleases
MQDFAVIDFGTANGRRSDVCNVGIMIVWGGEIVDRFYSLIQPVPNYYVHWTTEVHGLTRKDTDRKSTFLEVWVQIKKRIAGLPYPCCIT